MGEGRKKAANSDEQEERYRSHNSAVLPRARRTVNGKYSNESPAAEIRSAG
jgi:hypothetical protein